MIQAEQWVFYGWVMMLITIALQSCFHAVSEAQVAEHRDISAHPFATRLLWGFLRVTLSVGAGLVLGWILSIYSAPITEALRVVQDNLPPFVADPEELSPPHHFVREMAEWIEANPVRGWASAFVAFMTSVYVYQKPRKSEDHHVRNRYLLAIWGVNIVFALSLAENLYILLPWFVFPILLAKGLMYFLRIIDVWRHTEPIDWASHQRDSLLMLGVIGLIYGVSYMWLAVDAWGLNIDNWIALTGLGAAFGLPLVYVTVRMRSFMQGGLVGLILSLLFVTIVLLATGTPPAMLVDPSNIHHVAAPLVVIAPGMIFGGAFFAVTTHR